MTQKPTLEQFFELHKSKSFSYRVQLSNREGEWLIAITTDNADGETWTFAVNQNQLYYVSGHTGDSL